MDNTLKNELDALISDYETILPTIALESVKSAQSTLESEIRTKAAACGFKVSFLANYQVVLIED